MLTCFQENTNLPTTLLSRLPISLSKRNENLALDFFFFSFSFLNRTINIKEQNIDLNCNMGRKWKSEIRKNRLLPWLLIHKNVHLQDENTKTRCQSLHNNTGKENQVSPLLPHQNHRFPTDLKHPRWSKLKKIRFWLNPDNFFQQN